MKKLSSRSRFLFALLGLNAVLLLGGSSTASAAEQFPGYGACGYCIQGDQVFACCQYEICPTGAPGCCQRTGDC